MKEKEKSIILMKILNMKVILKMVNMKEMEKNIMKMEKLNMKVIS